MKFVRSLEVMKSIYVKKIRRKEKKKEEKKLFCPSVSRRPPYLNAPQQVASGLGPIFWELKPVRSWEFIKVDAASLWLRVSHDGRPNSR